MALIFRHTKWLSQIPEPGIGTGKIDSLFGLSIVWSLGDQKSCREVKDYTDLS
jgi:hypothetical protein